MIRVEGFAAPYREANNYGETFATRAFAGKLQAIEMRLMHEIPVGIWDDVWDDENGIWVRGRVLAPVRMDRIIRDLPELSVSWICRPGAKQREMRARHDGEFDPCIVGPNDTAGLAEVSLVDSGAFRGTHWRIIE